MAEHAFFAVCPRGLEAPLLRELAALGAGAPEAAGAGVRFRGALATAYAANLHSRLASRILWRVGGGPYGSADELYQLARDFAWELQFDARRSLRVDVTARRSPLQSLQFATLRIKDAIVDRLRERSGARPSIDRAQADVQVLAHLEERRAELYIDLSGEALFKRGWRADKGEAPIKENLAAALLQLSGWTPELPLLDPFCGSGTIVIEAACIASRRAPGLQRHFAFERLLGFERAAWQELRARALAAVDDRAAMELLGRDISTRVIELARANAARAGLAGLLRRGCLAFEPGDARTGVPAAARGMIVSNPPYGEQSRPKSAQVGALMGDFAAQLKRQFAGWQAWLLSTDRGLPGQMRLREARKTLLYNGALECRFFRFDLVAGSLRRARPAAGGRPPPGPVQAATPNEASEASKASIATGRPNK